MKHNGNIIIEKPAHVVAELFMDPRYLAKYQEGFERKELISGQAGKNGAVSKLYYKHGKRQMELTETIISNNMPESLKAFYHHKHMDNTMICKFIPLTDHSTRYETEVEYTRIDWFLPRFFAILFPNMYKKPAEKWMHNFKDFVENYDLESDENK
ncbi:hypothetical protein BFP97_05415 [Roseivirga sp. 4D4]|uniref:SRPBCC family protein n=1 Tax=Roseivirga sp. 4D4 TaxID=1889784 RepID=UPI00085342EB|nr:SRPBCC family protein [Roseivirga sp. 4D4]OEK00982.1 hypothetical protein BFP97_05415 [Roseivirga sp. 4D4]